MSVLSVHNLTKIFGTYTAVNNISFELRKGEILGFLGSNGAGKTTTIQMLLGTLTPTSGSINYLGLDFAKHQIAALKKIGYASGYEKLPPRLTVLENLDIIGRIYSIPNQERMQRIAHLLQAFKIEQFKNKPTGTLSAGQGTRVMLAKAFLANPEVVLLDEPTASLDPDIAQEVREFILEQRKERNISLLLTSHNMAEVTQLCDRVLVLKHGTIIANNTPAQLAQSISKVRVRLLLTSPADAAQAYLDNNQSVYTRDGQSFTVELDEHAIAQFLTNLGEQKIMYSAISIDKPTLEDYFLSIVRTKELS